MVECSGDILFYNTDDYSNTLGQLDELENGGGEKLYGNLLMKHFRAPVSQRKNSSCCTLNTRDGMTSNIRQLSVQMT